MVDFRNTLPWILEIMANFMFTHNRKALQNNLFMVENLLLKKDLAFRRRMKRE
jgi:hypothetical protein